MSRAVSAVVVSGISIRKAALMYDIPIVSVDVYLKVIRAGQCVISAWTKWKNLFLLLKALQKLAMLKQ